MKKRIYLNPEHYFKGAIISLLERGEITTEQANKCLRNLTLRNNKLKYKLIMQELNIPIIK